MAGAAGAISVGLLLFEVSMTRLFSVVLNYHFVFLAVSVALLGLGLGGAVCQVFRRAGLPRTVPIAVLSAGLTGLMIPAVTSLMVYPPWGANWVVYGVFAVLPFVFAGTFFAFIFQGFAEASGLLYGADLLGAGVGCLLSIWLLWRMDAITVMLCAGLPPLVGAVALALTTHRRRIALWWAIITLMLAVTIAANLRFGPLDVPLAASYDLQMKTMFAALGDRHHPARILETRWSALARTDLVQFPDPDIRAVFTDAGAGTLMLRFDGDWGKLAALRRETGFLPFAVGPHQQVLVIGPGGGKDVLLALMGGARHVTAVEVNPATVAFVRDHSSFAGQIYNRPDVRVVIAEGRSLFSRAATAMTWCTSPSSSRKRRKPWAIPSWRTSFTRWRRSETTCAICGPGVGWPWSFMTMLPCRKPSRPGSRLFSEKGSPMQSSVATLRSCAKQIVRVRIQESHGILCSS